MIRTWCVGGKNYSNTNILTQYGKKTLRLKNLLEFFKEFVVFVVVIKTKFLLTK